MEDDHKQTSGCGECKGVKLRDSTIADNPNVVFVALLALGTLVALWHVFWSGIGS